MNIILGRDEKGVENEKIDRGIERVNG